MRISILVFAVVTGYNAWSQSDSTLYINGLPVSEDDTVRNFPSTNYYPKNNEVIVGNRQLPEKLLDKLKKQSVYKGWERFPVLYNKSTDRYTVRVLSQNDTLYFGLDGNGNAVSYGKKNRDNQ